MSWARDRFWIIGVAVLFGSLALFGLGSCIAHAVTRHHATHGTVIDRSHSGEWWQPIVIPGHCSTTGSTTICTPTTTTIIHHPESWDIRVQDETGTRDDHEVSESTYDTCTIGTFYPDDGEVCTTP